MKLKELLKGIDVKNDFENVDVLDVTQDSRLVKDGSLFISIKMAFLRACLHCCALIIRGKL